MSREETRRDEMRREEAGKETARQGGRAAAAAYPQDGVAHTCRSYREYMDMFGLEENDLDGGPVLDVAGGASGFTAELAARGMPAVAADPFYAGLPEEILEKARTEIGVSAAKLEAAASSYDWSYYGSPERHRGMREASLAKFAEDFMRPDAPTRYAAASLPSLPFADNAFGLAVCSHFLFLYADSFGEKFHSDALRELLRVVRPGGEVRVYPLVTLKWEQPAYLPRILTDLGDVSISDLMPTRLPFIPAESGVLRLRKKA